MRTVLFSSLIAILASVTTYAQPIITPGGINPVDGDIFYGHRVGNDLSVGLSGADVAWNFALLKDLELDTTSYFTCDATPYCIMYQGNVQEVEGLGNIKANTGARKTPSMAGLNVVFGNHLSAMQYRHSYSWKYSDTFNATGTLGNVYHSEVDSYFYDGYGTLYLPSGRDTGVARVHTIAYMKDSSGAGVAAKRVEYYAWYRPGFHNPLLIVRYDTTRIGRRQVTYASYFSDKANGSPLDASLLAASLIVSPNPSTNELHISFNAQRILVSTIYITDLSGRVVATIKNSDTGDGVKDVTYPLGFFQPGVYFVHLASSVGRISKQIVIRKDY